MTVPKRSLKVCIFYLADDLPVVKLLSERLEWDDVDVLLNEVSAIETPAEDVVDASDREEKEQEVQNDIQDANVILFCLSSEFCERDSLSDELQFVLDAAASNSQVSKSILLVRLDECDLPAPMMKWHTIDLFKGNGYEELMLAMKFQADMENIELKADLGWKARFVYPRTAVKQEVKAKKPRSFVGMLLAITAIVLGVSYLLRTLYVNISDAGNTSVRSISEKATENAQLAVANKTATSDARVLALTQTAVYSVSIQQTKAKAQFEARITPTLTITPTITVSPTLTSTVVPVPVQILGVGNVSMVLIPGGSFLMGNAEVVDASPVSSVDLKPYYIDQFEVTNTLYRKCVQAGVCQPPVTTDSQTLENYYGSNEYANYPVINVDWYMARTFCEWRDARLPTEAEWEKAARGENSSSYPWGDMILCPFANYTASDGACIGDTQPVDKYMAGVSMYNVYNMSGNVAEWVGSLHLPYPYSTFDDRDTPTSIGPRVVRGGSWTSTFDELLAYRRIALDPKSYFFHGNDLGFRCAQDAN